MTCVGTLFCPYVIDFYPADFLITYILPTLCLNLMKYMVKIHKILTGNVQVPLSAFSATFVDNGNLFTSKILNYLAKFNTRNKGLKKKNEVKLDSSINFK